MKGVRIQAIVRELNNEKIDIVNHSSEPSLYISRALTPVKPVKTIVNEEEKMAVVIISDSQMALAIGRTGQNLRLASELTGYQIEPIKESDYEAQVDESYILLEDIPDLSKSVRTKLLEQDLKTRHEVLNLGVEGLVELPGIGLKTAEKIISILSDFAKSTEVVEEKASELEEN